MFRGPKPAGQPRSIRSIAEKNNPGNFPEEIQAPPAFSFDEALAAQPLPGFSPQGQPVPAPNPFGQMKGR